MQYVQVAGPLGALEKSRDESAWRLFQGALEKSPPVSMAAFGIRPSTDPPLRRRHPEAERRMASSRPQPSAPLRAVRPAPLATYDATNPAAFWSAVNAAMSEDGVVAFRVPLPFAGEFARMAPALSRRYETAQLPLTRRQHAHVFKNDPRGSACPQRCS